MARKDENGDVNGEDASSLTPVSLQEPPAFRAVEEHAAALKISAPVFAAVKAANGWNAGKKVEKTEFEKAVDGFLNAPMGGK